MLRGENKKPFKTRWSNCRFRWPNNRFSIPFQIFSIGKSDLNRGPIIVSQHKDQSSSQERERARESERERRLQFTKNISKNINKNKHLPSFKRKNNVSKNYVLAVRRWRRRRQISREQGEASAGEAEREEPVQPRFGPRLGLVRGHQHREQPRVQRNARGWDHSGEAASH